MATDDLEVTAKARRAIHRMVKKRGKRDGENAVREFNVLATNPSVKNIEIYFQHHAGGTGTILEELSEDYIIAVRDIIAKLLRITTKSAGWKCEMLSDLVDTLIHKNYELLEQKRALLNSIARKSDLSNNQVSETFSPAANPGTLVDPDDQIKKNPKTQWSFE